VHSSWRSWRLGGEILFMPVAQTGDFLIKKKPSFSGHKKLPFSGQFF